MSLRRALPLLLSLALPLPATAGEAHDLRDIPQPRAGERRRVVESVLEEGTLVVRRPDGEVVDRRSHAAGYRQAYVEEVEHVDAREGAVTQAVRRYEEAVELGAAGDEAALPERGVRVAVERTPRGDYALAPADPEQPLPAPLERILLHEEGRDGPARGHPLVWRYRRPRAWPVPAEPQPLGGGWDVPLEVAARLLDVPPEDVGSGSTARGRLEEGEEGALRVVLDIELALGRFQGLPCSGDPFRLEVEVTVERAGRSVHAEMRGAAYGEVVEAAPAAGEDAPDAEGGASPAGEVLEVDLALRRSLRLDPLDR